MAALGVCRAKLIDTYSPNLVNFDLEVPRYHAATCMSHSLMHLYGLQRHRGIDRGIESTVWETVLLRGVQSGW